MPDGREPLGPVTDTASSFARPPDAAALIPGDLLAARYRVRRFLARGGMGEVYEAHDHDLDVPIALKTVRPEVAASASALRRFKQEVLLARSVTHPNVCRIYDLGRRSWAGAEVSFLTMELLAGESLSARIRARGRIAPGEALAIVRQLAAGLDAAHLGAPGDPAGRDLPRVDAHDGRAEHADLIEHEAPQAFADRREEHDGGHADRERERGEPVPEPVRAERFSREPDEVPELHRVPRRDSAAGSRAARRAGMSPNTAPMRIEKPSTMPAQRGLGVSGRNVQSAPATRRIRNPAASPSTAPRPERRIASTRKRDAISRRRPPSALISPTSCTRSETETSMTFMIPIPATAASTLGPASRVSTSIPASFRSAAYPKAQVSWVLSEEPFFPAGLPMSNFRVRAAYGQSGVQPGATDALRYFESVTAAIAGADVPGLRLVELGNDSLKPERSAEMEVGFDADFLEGRAHLEVTYYNKRTTDALVERRLPPSLGGPTDRFENLGSTRNRGLEGVLTANLGLGSSTTLDLTLQGSRNVNKLLTLGENVTPIILGVIRHVPGYPLYGYWDRPVKSFSDADGDGIIELNEIVVGDTAEYLGPSIPRTELSFNVGLALFDNRIRIGGQLYYRGDFKQNNFTEYFRCTSTSANNCFSINDRTASFADQANAVAARNVTTGRTNAGYIVDGEFLRLRELSLTFSAPTAWARALRASRLSLTATGRNLALWTKYPGVDPEVSGAGQTDQVRDFLTQPPVRYWTFRVNFGF